MVEQYSTLIVSKVFDQPREMISRFFRTHGQFCASRPWEVIVGTITLVVCALSMSLFAATDRGICGWNIKCITSDQMTSADVLVLTLTKSLAVIYIYLQFRNLRMLGSKYLLGIAGTFTIFSSFVFSIAIINLLGSDLTGLNEALPFFLLLVDLSKACALARFALSSKSQNEVADNIGRGMAIIGPSVTLDAVVSTLVIGVGTLSGVKALETMCCFGCLSVVANYLAFMTFYPACLALVLELSRERLVGRVDEMEVQLTKVIEESEDKPNPVTQRVKVIMSAGLMLVHAHSRLWTYSLPSEDETRQNGGDPFHDYIHPDMPLWKFFFYKCATPGVDNVVPGILGTILALKYIFLDGYLEKQLLNPDTQAIEDIAKEGDFPITQSETNCSYTNVNDVIDAKGDTAADLAPPVTSQMSAQFSIGDSDEEDDDEEDYKQQFENHRPPQNEASTQTDWSRDGLYDGPVRSVDVCSTILASEDGLGARQLLDEEIMLLLKTKKIKAHQLEKALADHERGVKLRRDWIFKDLSEPGAVTKLPFQNYDYTKVEGACCENVIGYMPVPVGYAGPLLLNGKKYTIPLATTEGCLVASANRGCLALTESGGVSSMVLKQGMTRAPVVRFSSAMLAGEARQWMEKRENFEAIADAFNSTSRFARLKELKIAQASRLLFIRFVASTGDAMGMNMLSKGSEKALRFVQETYFQDMEIISLSGNYCTDKKPAAVNWVEGRGCSVVCEAVVPARVVEKVLKTTVADLVELNVSKNYMGSAMAGSIGGYNAHAANIVTALYIATGQDPAQNIASSNCLTVMEARGDDLYTSVTMPSVELGTVGGGTVLPPQAACLEMLGVRGSCAQEPGAHARTLAQLVCATVLAGELSLMSALAAGHLVKSHLKHNRSSVNMAATDTPRSTPSTSPMHVIKEEAATSASSSPVAHSTPKITLTTLKGEDTLLVELPPSDVPGGTCTYNAS